jgi:hypothetical protein
VRRTLEKELTRAILDGRLGEGARVRASTDENGGVGLEVSEATRAPASEPVAS